MNSLEMELKKCDEFRKKAYDLKMNYLLQMKGLANDLGVSDADLVREMKNQVSMIEIDLHVAELMDFDFPSVITL